MNKKSTLIYELKKLKKVYNNNPVVRIVENKINLIVLKFIVNFFFPK